MKRFLLLLTPFAFAMMLYADVADACPCKVAPRLLGVLSAPRDAVSSARSRTRTRTRTEAQAAPVAVGIVPLAVAPVQTAQVYGVPAPAATARAEASANADAGTSQPATVQGYYLPPQPQPAAAAQGGVATMGVVGALVVEQPRNGPLDRIRNRRGSTTVTVSESSARTRTRSNR
jgi:hypothetical protein